MQVIDFGLVKLGDGESTTGSWGGELLDTGDSEGSGPTGSRTAWSDELTRNGAVVGTVAYMAPEQITGEAVDARADQFSFCVALYEAIYRVRPFSGANREQLVMRVLEGKVDPAPANARVPSWLRRICLRGLSPIPGRRFASMDELLAALERGLARRRRVGYLAAAAASVLLAGVGSFFHGQTSAPPDACAQARAEMGSIWDADTRASVQNALLSSREPYAAATWQTVDRTIAGLDRARARTLDLTCEERTGAGLSREQLTRRILCVAETDRAISGVLSQLADRTMDLSVAVDAVADLPDPGRCLDDALLTRLESETALEGATILKDNLARQLAEVERVAQVGEYRRGLELAVAATRAAESLGDPELRARAWQLRGQLEDHTGDPEAAARSFDRSQQLAANVGAHVTWTRAVAGKLWALGEGQGELTDAVWWSKELAAAHEHLAHAGLAEAELLASTGDLLESRGDQNEALAAYRKALALHERAYGPDHPQVALSLSDLGVALYRLDRLDEARATLERARAILEASVGPEHPQVATALSNLALVLQAQGDLEEAAKLHALALTIEERTRGPGHPALAISHHNLGYLAFARGDYQGSIEHYTRALEIFEQGGSRDHLRIASTENALGISLKRLSRGDEALPHYRRALELRARQLPEDSVLLASTRHNLGRLLLEQGEPREAAALLEQALTVREEALAAEDTQLAKTRRSLGIALVEAGELERARPVLERALVVDRANVASELEQPLALAETRFALARALDDPDRAVRLARLADEAHASAGASTSSPERRAIAAFLQ
ncbi:MAG: tetratricopeptide repeat protein, partial [Myxococcales bacterium]|nr:tetratricopeptide repeat protein [Myxococcales bacterium]